MRERRVAIRRAQKQSMCILSDLQESERKMHGLTSALRVEAEEFIPSNIGLDIDGLGFSHDQVEVVLHYLRPGVEQRNDSREVAFHRHPELAHGGASCRRKLLQETQGQCELPEIRLTCETKDIDVVDAMPSVAVDHCAAVQDAVEKPPSNCSPSASIGVEKIGCMGRGRGSFVHVAVQNLRQKARGDAHVSSVGRAEASPVVESAVLCRGPGHLRRCEHCYCVDGRFGRNRKCLRKCAVVDGLWGPTTCCSSCMPILEASGSKGEGHNRKHKPNG